MPKKSNNNIRNKNNNQNKNNNKNKNKIVDPLEKKSKRELLEMLQSIKSQQSQLEIEKKKIQIEKDQIEKDKEKIDKEMEILEQLTLSSEEKYKEMMKEMEKMKIYKQVASQSHNEISPEEVQDLEAIGSGAYGNVFRAIWRGKEVAVKRIKPEYVRGEHLEEFKREVLVLSRTRHPNIVLFMGACTQLPNLFLVTEYCHHGSLFQMIRSSQTNLTYQEKIKAAKDIALGMTYLHLTKPKIIIHRDLKSSNVLIDSSGTAKVADFGLSRIKDESLKHTRFRGTPCYMAPEMLKSTHYTEKVDVFSYGILLWELYTQQFPYKGIKNPIQIAFNVGFHDLRPPLSNIKHGQWKKLLEMCWDKDPLKRPSFPQILKILDQFSEN
ncbi:serine/threonine-protein kinase edr1 [Anaeramoeba flamelloides]|nr:serine/threonine-protein kinase edr1 [Anaeramoeba flamelloides]